MDLATEQRCAWARQALSTSIDHPCVFVSTGDVPFQGTERTIKVGSERDCRVGPWPMRRQLEALFVREALFGVVRPGCVLSRLAFPPPRQPQQPGTMGLAEHKAQQPSLHFLPSEAGARAGAGMWNSRFLSGLDIGSQPKPALRTLPDQVPGVDMVRRTFGFGVRLPRIPQGRAGACGLCPLPQPLLSYPSGDFFLEFLGFWDGPGVSS